MHSYLEVQAGQLYQLTKKIWEENKAGKFAKRGKFSLWREVTR